MVVATHDAKLHVSPACSPEDPFPAAFVIQLTADEILFNKGVSETNLVFISSSSRAPLMDPAWSPDGVLSASSKWACWNARTGWSLQCWPCITPSWSAWMS